MKKVLWYALAGVVVILVGILGYAATKPDTFRVERSLSMAAPPEKIAPLINDFRNWSSWSPYEKLDPNMKRGFSGSAYGVGAVYTWDGNDKAGSGRMEITDTSSNRVVFKLDILKPFEGHNIAEFRLEASAGATNVTWAMHGPSPYVSKVMGVFFDMDRLIGKDFESGLANLKATAEQ